MPAEPPLDIRNFALAFSVGVVAAHWLPWLHALWPWLLAGGAACLPPRRLRLVALAMLGLGWGAWHATQAVQGRVDKSCVDAEVVGRVATLPARQPLAPSSDLSAQSFVFAPEQASCDIRGHIKLHWVRGPTVNGGDRWRLQVRLKPPRATANASGYDRARAFARDRLAATGYVKSGARLAPAPQTSIVGWRERLRERLKALPLLHGGIVAALALGDAAAIPEAAMERFRRTGTLHLMVISGLHIGIVTALGFLLGRGLGLLFGLSPKGVGVALGLGLGIAYVALAGAGLSLLRAFAMTTAGMVALVAGRASTRTAVFSYALAFVLAIDPMAPLAAGFWLSFGAVAVLLGVFAPRPRPRSWVTSALAAQLAILAVFTPASIGLTGLVHPLSFGVNLLVVPLATMFAVPLALAGTALLGLSLDTIARWTLVGADFCIAVVDKVLEVADGVAPFYVPDLGGWQWWLVVAAAACLLPLARLALVALATTVAAVLALPLLFPSDPPAFGEARVTALDVGQGTAVIVETARHTLVYDTGPGFPGSPGSGALTVLPALRSMGRGTIDALVLSHGDGDHIGGAAAVRDGTRAGRVLLGEAVAGIDGQACVEGMAWRWDGVDFSVLGPPAHKQYAGNNASCVLLIEANPVPAGARPVRTLLAGDVETVAEGDLAVPAVDLLLVPHHGSRTSSSAPFVAASRPRFAVVSAAFETHFGHPHADVVQRYRNVGAHLVSTGVLGAIAWRSASPAQLQVQRCRPAPYWRLAETGSRLLASCGAFAPDAGR